MTTRVLRLLKPFRLTLLVVLAGLITEMAFNSLVPLALRFLIDNVLAGGSGAKLIQLLSVLAGGAITASLVGLVRDRAWARIQANLIGGLRQHMFSHLQNLPVGFFQSGEGGNVVSAFSSDLATIENASTMAIPWGLLPGFECIFSSILLVLLDWRLSLAAMLLWPWTILTPRLSSEKAQTANDARHEEEASLLTELQENLVVQPVVKVFGLRDLRVSAFAKRNRQWSETAARAGATNAVLERSTTSGILLIQVAVLTLAAWMAFTHQISVGTLVSFQALLLLLSNNLLYVMQYMPSLVAARGAMTRVGELLDERPEVADESGAQSAPQQGGDIEFRDVTFGYTPDRLILQGVNLRIPAGKSVSFVGGSGCGKSTMLNLLMRFYEPQSGTVSLSGKNINDFSLASWRSRLGVVFQESLLFNLPLAENIRMARPDALDAEVKAAAAQAEIDAFIKALPEGYGTPAGDRGGRLSGGQRQRVSIARAILRNPPILLLDEATSALDPATEASINGTLTRLSAGRTSISVTHRLASAATSDLIFVFDKGKVVESGSHDELLAKDGIYAALWNKQRGFNFSPDGSHATVSVERLAQIPLLSELDPEDLAAIAPMFRSEPFRAGQDVVVEGDSSGSFYIVVRGRVEVIKSQERIAVLEDGDYFGEISLLTGAPRTATVRTISSTTCISLDKEAFDKLLGRSKEVKEKVWRAARTRLGHLAGVSQPTDTSAEASTL